MREWIHENFINKGNKRVNGRYSKINAQMTMYDSETANKESKDLRKEVVVFSVILSTI